VVPGADCIIALHTWGS